MRRASLLALLFVGRAFADPGDDVAVCKVTHALEPASASEVRIDPKVRSVYTELFHAYYDCNSTADDRMTEESFWGSTCIRYDQGRMIDLDECTAWGRHDLYRYEYKIDSDERITQQTELEDYCVGLDMTIKRTDYRYFPEEKGKNLYKVIEWYEYDADGRLCKDEPSVYEYYTYDKDHRLTELQRVGPNVNQSVRFQKKYDACGRISEMIYSEQGIVCERLEFKYLDSGILEVRHFIRCYKEAEFGLVVSREWVSWMQLLDTDGRRIEEFQYNEDGGATWEHKKVSYKYTQTPIGKVVTEMLMEDFLFDVNANEEYKSSTLRETYEYEFVTEEKQK